MFILSIFISLLCFSFGIYGLIGGEYLISSISIAIGLILFITAIYQRNKHRKKKKADDSCLDEVCSEIGCGGFGDSGGGCDCGP